MNEFLATIGQFTEEEEFAFENAGQFKAVPAKTCFYTGDTAFTKMYLIKSGIVRSFRLIDGEDFTYLFFAKNNFACDFQSYLTGEKSPLLFETLTDTEFLIFEKKAIYAIYEKFPKFEKLGRLMAEKAYLVSAERLKQYQTDDLKTRYLKLLSQNPTLFQQVPQHYIATYLGVKPRSLSRMRAEISGKKY